MFIVLIVSRQKNPLLCVNFMYI